MGAVLLALATTAGACATPSSVVRPTAVATGSPPIASSPSPLPPDQPFVLEASLRVNDDPRPIDAGYRANGDEMLTFRLDFFADMDHDSVVTAVMERTPEARSFRWDMDDRSVLFDVPPGNTTFVVDPTGARTSKGNGIAGGKSWRVERPRTELSFYSPIDVAAGRINVISRRTFAFIADPGFAVFDRSMKTAVLGTGTPRPERSFVDLTTGSRAAVPWDINKISRDGAMLQWLPDDRFLTLGTHDTIVSGPRGQNMRWLPTAQPGQTGSVSPSGHEVALWSYTANDLTVLNLDTGALRTVATDLKRCGAYWNASVSWSPSGRTIAVGHCTEDLGGVAVTTFIDAARGRQVGLLRGWTITAWLADGRMLGKSFGPTGSAAYRPADPGVAVFDSTGEQIGSLDVDYYATASPDGRWLLEIETDTQTTEARLIDTHSGQSYPFLIENVFPVWTPDGRIAVLREVR